MKITHSTVVNIPDDPPAGGVGEEAWNDDHVVEGAGELIKGVFSASGSTAGTEQFVLITGGGNVTLTLTNPTIDAGTAFTCQFKNGGSGTATLDAVIDVYTDWILPPLGSVTLTFDGTQWWIF